MSGNLKNQLHVLWKFKMGDIAQRLLNFSIVFLIPWSSTSSKSISFTVYLIHHSQTFYVTQKYNLNATLTRINICQEKKFKILRIPEQVNQFLFGRSSSIDWNVPMDLMHRSKPHFVAADLNSTVFYRNIRACLTIIPTNMPCRCCSYLTSEYYNEKYEKYSYFETTQVANIPIDCSSFPILADMYLISATVF